MIRKAVMGYLPEEEMSYKQTTAKAQAEAAALRDQYEVREARGNLTRIFILIILIMLSFFSMIWSSLDSE